MTVSAMLLARGGRAAGIDLGVDDAGGAPADQVLASDSPGVLATPNDPREAEDHGGACSARIASSHPSGVTACAQAPFKIPLGPYGFAATNAVRFELIKP